MKPIFVLIISAIFYTTPYKQLSAKSLESNNLEFQSGVEPIINGFLDRKVKKKPVVFIDQKGAIATKICINGYGKVTYVELNGTETTIQDKVVLKGVLKATREFEFDRKSVKEQCGTITYVVP